MTSTAHALVAGAIATHFTNPITAVGVALASHFVMDSIPHWDFGTNWRDRPKYQTGLFAILETLFGIGLSLFIFSSSASFPLLLATIIASLLPDWLEAPWYIFFANSNHQAPSKNAGVLEKFSYVFYKIPNVFHTRATFPLGVITQIVAVIFFLVVLG